MCFVDQLKSSYLHGGFSTSSAFLRSFKHPAMLPSSHLRKNPTDILSASVSSSSAYKPCSCVATLPWRFSETLSALCVDSAYIRGSRYPLPLPWLTACFEICPTGLQPLFHLCLHGLCNVWRSFVSLLLFRSSPALFLSRNLKYFFPLALVFWSQQLTPFQGSIDFICC